MKVVLIDDDAMVLKSLNSALAALGFSVKAFGDSLKALEWMAEHPADIVVSDICMPECDGFEVLKRVKEIDPNTDVLFVTAHGQLDTAIRALRDGAADFVEKPISTSALKAAIERTERFRVLSQQRDLLADKVDMLNNELLSRTGKGAVMIGESVGMKHVAEQIVNVAASDATILILGESGTGKELVANAIHEASPRKNKPFLTVNCPSIPEDLFESEMFGHRRGAFTGAVETRGGYVEAASEGTLFLDEIGDLPLKSQAKILRLLEQKTYLPVGEQRERAVDVRVLAATNQDLSALAKEKQFREDLFYRLGVCVIEIPPLRQRKSDIPLLALYFTLQFAFSMGKSLDGIDSEGLRALAAHDFPGNIRELRNVIESSVIHCRHSGLLTKDDFPTFVFQKRDDSSPSADDPQAWPIEDLQFESVERSLYEEALRRSNRNVSAAARLLGLSRGKLRRRLEHLNIEEDDS